jgi:hypothetical protein
MGRAWLRRVWARWSWPIVTFVVIGAFMIVAVVLRGGGDRSDAATPNAFLPPLEPAQHVPTREWRTIAADPAGHADERVVLWGRVTAFDPAIDASSFTANVDSARHTPVNGTVNYPTPVVLHGAPDLFRKLATGYIFTAEATVDGAPARAGGSAGGSARAGGSDDVGPRPQAGGGVPVLTVTKLTVTDKTVG